MVGRPTREPFASSAPSWQPALPLYCAQRFSSGVAWGKNDRPSWWHCWHVAVSVGDTNDRSVSLCDLTSGQLGEGGAHLHSPPMHALGRKPGLALMLVLIFPSFKAPHKVNEHYSCQVAEEDAEGLNSFLKSNRSPPKHHSCSPGCKSFMQFFTTPVERISCPFIVKGNKMHSRPISRYVCMYV